MTSFAPTVLLPDGRTVTPAGWMWVLALALAGSRWAIDEASTPAFRERVRDEISKRRRNEAEAEIAALESRIARIRQSLSGGEK